MIGTTTTMAEKMCMKHPTASRNTFRTRRKATREWIAPRTPSRIVCRTPAPTPSPAREKGLRRARARTPPRTAQDAMIAIRKTPGRNPPRNILSTAIPATTAYRITGRHGGKSIPRDPEDVRRTRENPPRDPSRRRAGRGRGGRGGGGGEPVDLGGDRRKGNVGMPEEEDRDPAERGEEGRPEDHGPDAAEDRRDQQGEERDHVMPVGPLRPDQLEPRPGEEQGDGGRDRGGEDGQDPPVRVGKPVRETPQGQEGTVPRADRPPPQADPEGWVLDEGGRSGG